MKKIIFLSGLLVVLVASAVIYSCSKDKLANVSQNASSATNKEVSTDRNGVCSTITVGRGVGLVICGTDSGTTDCTACGESHKSEVINNAAALYNFTGSSVFSLYNPTGSAITVAISFNCVNQAPQWFTINPGQTKSFTTTVINGCCFAVACGGG